MPQPRRCNTAKAHLSTLAANSRIKAKNTTDASRSDKKVPRGRSLPGSRSSPLGPVTVPITAGKNTPNNVNTSSSPPAPVHANMSTGMEVVYRTMRWWRTKIRQHIGPKSGGRKPRESDAWVWILSKHGVHERQNACRHDHKQHDLDFRHHLRELSWSAVVCRAYVSDQPQRPTRVPNTVMPAAATRVTTARSRTSQVLLSMYELSFSTESMMASAKPST